MKYPMVSVEWVDSGVHLENGWEPVEKYIARAREQFGAVSTVGHLIHEDELVVVVGLSVDEVNDAVFSAQVIAQTNVLKLRRLQDVA